jgi:hypothetical protein
MAGPGPSESGLGVNIAQRVGVGQSDRPAAYVSSS